MKELRKDVLRAIALVLVILFEVFAIWFIIHFDYMPRLLTIFFVVIGAWTGFGALYSLFSDVIPDIRDDLDS